MTIINPNSISGISSITALNSTAAINLFKADGTSANIIAGVTTGSNFITGTSNVHSTGYECTNINASGIVTAASLDISGDIDFDGHTELDNVRIAGVATFYQGGSEVVRINSGGLLAYNDISFFGASTHAYWDHSANQFKLNDDTKLSVGSNSDLQLYHDGSHSRIYNSTGNLSVRSAVFDVLNADGSERMLKATADSGCELFFNGNLKLQTRNTDTVFYDDIRLGDNHKVNVGTLDDMQLYHDGTFSYIAAPNNHQIHINASSGGTTENMAKFKPNGAVELYHDGSLKLSTGNNGINISGSIALADSGRLYLGSSNDAYLFHDGSNTHFYNQTGNLLIRQEANADVIVEANNIDRVRIYSDGVVAIGQSSKSSTVGAGGLDIQGNATNCILEMGNPFPNYSGGVVPEFRITATNSSHTVDFESVWGGDNLLHKHLAFSGGSTIFYKGTNNDETARFNSNKFGIGTQSPGDKLHVNGGDIIISNTNAPNLRVVNADDSTGANSNRAFFGIASGSNNYMNGTAANDLCIVGPDGGRMLFGYGNSIKFRMNNDGKIFSAATYNNTTSSSSRSVVMPNNTGEFFASTSSRKFKTNITTLTDALADKILECRPVSFNSLCSADNKTKTFYGLIAEEVHEIDTSLVAYDDENAETPEPTSVQYDRFVPHLINLVKRQKAQIATLEAKVAALEGA